MTPKHVDIDVQGTDMFGACFSESAKLVSVEDWEYLFSCGVLLRKVPE